MRGTQSSWRLSVDARTRRSVSRFERLYQEAPNSTSPAQSNRKQFAFQCPRWPFAVQYWLTGSRLETSLLLYWLALQHYPDTYHKRLKLKDPWFLTLLKDEFPRLAVHNRLPHKRIATFGPFPSREAAECVYQGTMGLFQIRRCEEKLAPSKDHPGCIYGEMNLCLRPCQLAVSAAEYAAEVARLSEFLEFNGRHTISVLTSARDRASSDTDFEQAARLHKDLEKVKAIAALRDESCYRNRVAQWLSPHTRIRPRHGCALAHAIRLLAAAGLSQFHCG